MSQQQTEPERIVASVLIVAADPSIESLVGQLVAFAGHRPVFDATGGAAGESVRRVRPDVTMVDTALPADVVRACIGAAHEVGSQPVLTSGTASTNELIEDARAEHCLFFPLPGGPRPLGKVLERALERRAGRPITLVPRRARTERVAGSVHPALCAALASIARARVLALRPRSARRQTHTTSDDTADTQAESRRCAAALRAAVADYTKQLKAADLSMDRVLTIVADAVSECAAVVGADAAIPALLLESESWAREAYLAA